MIIARVHVSGVSADAVILQKIPRGITGAEIEVSFDSRWSGLNKTAVFNGAAIKDVIDFGSTITIPVECVNRIGRRLKVGFYGTSGKDLIIPTLWADLGTVVDATDPSGDTSTDPALPVWAQIQAAIGNLDDLQTETKDTLVGAINEANRNGSSSGGGSVDLTGYATEQYVQEYAQPKGNYLTEHQSLEGYAKTADIPTKPEDIGAQPAGNYALKSEIPSVPVKSVNGKTGNVQLSASDVGALPSSYTPPNQTAEQVGADLKGTATSAVSQHNTADDSHNDIRLELKAINDRLTAFFDSDDKTLDELSEIVAYITSNKSLIDSITTSKVSVGDIINNLTTNVTNKPLSAAQGVVLKGLIDSVSNSLSNYALKSAIPTKVSQLQNDSGYLTQHQDISGKLDASALPTAINTALAQAKASGEFDGKTPVKCVDYWTDADQESIVQQVITALGTPVFGRVDADNNIILTGNLVDGVYTLKYEDAEGNVTEVGNIVIGEDDYVNWLPISTDTNGGIYNGTGYKVNVRLSASSGYTEKEIVTGNDVYLTGFIPVKTGDVLRFYNMTISDATDENYTGRIYVFDTSKVGVENGSAISYASTSGWNVVSQNGYVTEITYGGADGYIRINADNITADSIITINQEITGGETPDSGSIELTWAGGVKLDKNTGEEGSGSQYGASQSIPYDSGYEYTIATTDGYIVQTAICWYASDGSYLGWNDATGAGADGEDKTAVLVPLDNSASFRIRAYTIYGSDDELRTKALDTISIRKDSIQ